MKIGIDSGTLGLLATANKRTTYGGEKYFFKGDLIQKGKARAIATYLGIANDTDGAIPFVKSWKDFEMVKKYIIDHRIDGWWNYVTGEDYNKLKEE